MADGTPISNANSVTEEIATDELSTLNGADVTSASPRIKAQRVKLLAGDDGTGQDVSNAHPLPVGDAGGSLTVDGTVTANSSVGAGKTLSWGVINTASAGDNQLVAAQGLSATIYVVSFALVVSGAVSLQWKSAANNKSGAMAFGSNGGYALAGSVSAPVLAMNSNEALILNLSGAVQTSGHYCYFVA